MSALPTPYAPATSFSSDMAMSAGAVPSNEGAKWDAEFAAIQVFLTATQARLNQLQRSDGTLGTKVVSLDTLGTDVLLAIGSQIVGRGAWGTANSYLVGNVVIQSAISYFCVTSHVSGTFATDLASIYWIAISAGAVGAGLIQSSAAFAAGVVNSAAILDGTITGADIASATVTGANIAAGTVLTGNIGTNTILAGNLAAGSVTSAAILDGSIVAADIAPLSITNSLLATGSVSIDKLATGTGVTTGGTGASAYTTNSTTLSDVTGVLIPVASGSLIHFQSHVNMTTALAGMQIAFDTFVGSGSYNWYFIDNATGNVSAGALIAVASTSTTIAAGTLTGKLIVNGWALASAATNLQLRFKSVTAAQVTTVSAGSFIRG